jgi:dipeptidyl-peptidase-4
MAANNSVNCVHERGGQFLAWPKNQMNLNLRKIFILLAFAFPVIAYTQQIETVGVFTQEDSDRVDKMSPRTLVPKIKNAFVFPHWIGKTDDFWYLRQIPDGAVFVIVDAATGKSHMAFDHQQIAEAVARATGATATATHLPFEGIEFNSDRSSIHIVVKDKQYDCALKPASCSSGVPVPPEPLDVTSLLGVPPPVTDPNEGLLIAPNKRWAVLTRENNLWMHDMETGQERQLTRDGQENCGYGIYIGNFNTASIPRERMVQAGHHLPPMASYWSPDSRTVIVPHVDQRHVADYPYIETVPWDGSFRPKLHLVRIPLVGEKPGLIEWYIFNAPSGNYRRINLPYDKLMTTDSADRTVRKTWWSDDAQHLYMLVAGTHNQSAFLFDVDVSTGNARTVIEEHLPPRMELAPSDLEGIPIAWVDGKGKNIIWYSQRDGWGHLYLYDGETGKLKNQITRGQWLVRGVTKVDEERRLIYFTAGGREPGNPYYRYLYRTSFDGSDLKLLSPEHADHLIAGPDSRLQSFEPILHLETISPSGKYAVYNFSTPDQPPQAVIRSTADGRLIATVEKADVRELLAAGYHPPEEFVAKSADGSADLWCLIYKPSNFDPNKSYPVVDTQYATPYTTIVPRDFVRAIRGAGANSVGLAELGFIVVAIDGKGTPHRSREFHMASYGKMDINGLDDHVAVIQQMAKKFPYMDISRVGIMGGSFGGYSTIRAMLDFPDFFKVGVAQVTPGSVHNVYPDFEEYQGVPVYSDGSEWRPKPNEAPSNWQSINFEAQASRLKGHLQIHMGETDENVPPGSPLQFINALMEAGKNFELLYIPNANHVANLGPRPQYILRREYEYLVRYLRK